MVNVTGLNVLIRLAAVTCAMAIAACGSSTKSTTPASSIPLAAALKFAECMRSHGVANFPDPTTNGGASSAVSTIDKHSPAFQTAARHCSSLVPGEPSLATAPQTHLMERSEAENAQ